MDRNQIHHLHIKILCRTQLEVKLHAWSGLESMDKIDIF